MRTETILLIERLMKSTIEDVQDEIKKLERVNNRDKDTTWEQMVTYRLNEFQSLSNAIEDFKNHAWA